MTDVLVELRAANPAPADSEPHPTAWSDSALLAEIDTRSGTNMSLDHKPKTEPAGRANGGSGRHRALVAAAGFAVVVALIGVAAVVRTSDPTSSTSPATEVSTTAIESTTTNTPPTTTDAPVSTTLQLADEVPPEAQALLDNYTRVYNAGDEAAWVALHAPGTVRVATNNGEDWNTDLEVAAEFYTFFHGIGQTIDLTECEISVATGIAWCKAFRTDDLTRAADVEPWTLLGLRFDEDEIVEWREVFTGQNSYLSAIAEFGEWMSDTYPDEPPLVSGQGNDFIYAPENIERARQFLSLWSESREAAGE